MIEIGVSLWGMGMICIFGAMIAEERDKSEWFWKLTKWGCIFLILTCFFFIAYTWWLKVNII